MNITSSLYFSSYCGLSMCQDQDRNNRPRHRSSAQVRTGKLKKNVWNLIGMKEKQVEMLC